MPRLIHIALLLIITILTAITPPAHASQTSANAQNLIDIEGTEYSIGDFKLWWQNWHEKGMPFPKTLDSFIEWQLLAREATKMEMFKVPRFRHKIDTFLKVRAIMSLKNEEVDSKIDIPENALREIYEEQYAPQRNFQLIFYKTKESATKAYEELRQSKVSNPADLQDKPIEEGKPDGFQEKLLRPREITPQWQETAKNIKEGETSEPLPYNHGYLLIHLKSIKDGTEADFQNKKKTIKRKLWKQQKKELTRNLIKKLHEKYHVKIDQDILDNLDTENIPPELATKNIFTSTFMSLSVNQFAQKVLDEKELRRKMTFKPMDQKKFNKMVLGNIITQTLINQEAISRHYENNPPLKDNYKFYYKHRLVSEFEYQIFKTPSKNISDKEISAYYQDNMTQFTSPETVTYAEVIGEEAAVKKIWMGVLAGGDFSELAEKHLGLKPLNKTIAVTHLDPNTKNMIKNLVTNEVCPPFHSGNHSSMVKLIKRGKTTYIPLESVKQTISRKLESKKYKKLRDDYLAQLKTKTSITVNKNAWQTLQKELGEKR